MSSCQRTSTPHPSRCCADADEVSERMYTVPSNPPGSAPRVPPVTCLGVFHPAPLPDAPGCLRLRICKDGRSGALRGRTPPASHPSANHVGRFIPSLPVWLIADRGRASAELQSRVNRSERCHKPGNGACRSRRFECRRAPRFELQCTPRLCRSGCRRRRVGAESHGSKQRRSRGPRAGLSRAT